MKKLKSLIALLMAACMLVSCGEKATITIPSNMTKAMSSMDVGTKDMKYESKTTNSDGSITYEITVEQQEEILKTIREALEKAIPEMQKDPIKRIDFNSDLTKFKITTTSMSMTLVETLMTLVFYIYGLVYTIYDGKPDAKIVIEYINDKSGDVVKRFDSDELKKEFEEKYGQ